MNVMRQRGTEAGKEGEEAVLLTDRKGVVLSCNTAMEKLLGWSQGRLVGYKCASVMGGRGMEGEMICKENCVFLQRGEGQMVALEMSVRGAENTQAVVMRHASVVDEKGQDQGVLHVISLERRKRSRQEVPPGLYLG